MDGTTAMNCRRDNVTPTALSSAWDQLQAVVIEFRENQHGSTVAFNTQKLSRWYE